MTKYTRSCNLWIGYTVEADNHEDALALLQDNYVEHHLARALGPNSPLTWGEGGQGEEWLEIDDEEILDVLDFNTITVEDIEDYFADEIGAPDEA